jgi:hypothetical protein
MSRGAILFAFNSPKHDYYAMAEYTAKRINHFLDIPVTVVTNSESITQSSSYKFDNIVCIDADKSNKRSYSKKDTGVWINKGRFKAYDLSPYDETLVLDVDYVVNSNKLLKTFDTMDDFCCHENACFLMQPNEEDEYLSRYSFKTLWATVMAFKKTKRAKDIFDCIEMVQKNYSHYANLHNFISQIYRNDYALTLALRIANGHLVEKKDFIPWNLVHIGNNTQVYKNTNDEFNTEYTVMFDNWTKGKLKKEYITIKDLDMHLMNKKMFMGLML